VTLHLRPCVIFLTRPVSLPVLFSCEVALCCALLVGHTHLHAAKRSSTKRPQASFCTLHHSWFMHSQPYIQCRSLARRFFTSCSGRSTITSTALPTAHTSLPSYSSCLLQKSHTYTRAPTHPLPSALQPHDVRRNRARCDGVTVGACSILQGAARKRARGRVAAVGSIESCGHRCAACTYTARFVCLLATTK
jgi:hypothetical protein